MCEGVLSFIARLGFCASKDGLDGCLSNCSSNRFDCFSSCYKSNGWAPPPSTAEKIVYPTTAAILLLLSLVVACMMSTTLGIDMASLQMAIDGIDSVIRRQATKVADLRKRGSLLLTTLLIASTGLNVAFTILIADILGLLLGFIACTFLILIFVEVVPPAICANNALRIAANTAWFGKILVILLFPVAYPLSLVLDQYLANRDEEDEERDGCISIISRTLCFWRNVPPPLSPRVFVVNPLASKALASPSTLSPTASVASGDASHSIGFSEDMDSAQRLDMAGFGVNPPKSTMLKGYAAESSRARETMGGYSSRSGSYGQVGPSRFSAQSSNQSSEIEEISNNGDSRGFAFKDNRDVGRPEFSLDAKFSFMLQQPEYPNNHANRWFNPRNFHTVPGNRGLQYSAPELSGKPPRPLSTPIHRPGQNPRVNSGPIPTSSSLSTPSPPFEGDTNPEVSHKSRQSYPSTIPVFLSSSSSSAKESQTEFTRDEGAKDKNRIVSSSSSSLSAAGGAGVNISGESSGGLGHEKENEKAGVGATQSKGEVGEKSKNMKAEGMPAPPQKDIGSRGAASRSVFSSAAASLSAFMRSPFSLKHPLPKTSPKETHGGFEHKTNDGTAFRPSEVFHQEEPRGSVIGAGEIAEGKSAEKVLTQGRKEEEGEALPMGHMTLEEEKLEGLVALTGSSKNSAESNSDVILKSNRSTSSESGELGKKTSPKKKILGSDFVITPLSPSKLLPYKALGKFYKNESGAVSGSDGSGNSKLPDSRAKAQDDQMERDAPSELPVQETFSFLSKPEDQVRERDSDGGSERDLNPEKRLKPTNVSSPPLVSNSQIVSEGSVPVNSSISNYQSLHDAEGLIFPAVVNSGVDQTRVGLELSQPRIDQSASSEMAWAGSSTVQMVPGIDSDKCMAGRSGSTMDQPGLRVDHFASGVGQPGSRLDQPGLGMDQAGAGGIHIRSEPALELSFRLPDESNSSAQGPSSSSANLPMNPLHGSRNQFGSDPSIISSPESAEDWAYPVRRS